MADNLKDLLYYPLGIVPCVFFSLRFILQWITSEKLRTSHVNSTFWRLSLCGNTLAAIHYFIQLQYLFFFIQFINGFISRRNLVAMKAVKHKATLTTELLLFFVFLIIASIAFFFCCGFIFFDTNRDFLALQILGIFGGFLFASRFWVQWWNTEKNGASTLNRHFWILSILGGVLTISYTIAIGDSISTFNYLFGMVPYVRNLILIKRTNKKNVEEGRAGVG